MTWVRGGLLLATGTVAVVVGAILAAPAAAAAGAAAAGTAGAASAAIASSAVVGGTLGSLGANYIADGGVLAFDRVANILRSRSPTGGTPINHDLARAIRLSHLDALRFVLTNCIDSVAARNRWGPRLHRVDLSRFERHARRWIDDEAKAAERPDFLADQELEDSIDEVRAIIEGASGNTAEIAYQKLANSAANDALNEFLDKITEGVPELFVEHFWGTKGSAAWSVAAQSYFAERLKTQERLRTVVLFDRLKELAEGQDKIAHSINDVLIAIRDLDRGLADRFAALERRCEELAARNADFTIDTQLVVDDLIRQLSEGKVVDQIARSLALGKGSRHSVAQTAHQVMDRRAELTDRFFGREDAIAALDHFADSKSPGILVVAAPAGGGKSALLANWVRQREKTDPNLISHFISNRKSLTTGPAEIAGHLLAQLEMAEGVTAEGGLARGQNLYSALVARQQPVTIVLDGLDEAATLIEPFVEAGSLPPHVRLIVSGRAEPGDWPNYLEPWRARQTHDFAVDRIDLPGLDTDTIQRWLEDFIGHLPDDEMQRLAEGLWRASDGRPLYLKYILEDFHLRLPDLKTPEARLAIVRDLPSPFADYLATEMRRPPRTELQEPGWTDKHRSLFALLSVTMGPIAFDEIEAIGLGHPDLDALPHRFSRWLSFGVGSKASVVSFAHPLLASAFRQALEDRVDAAEEMLLQWAVDAWRPTQSFRGLRPGADYALDWLPEHLRLASPDRCVALLINPDFLVAQLDCPLNGYRRFESRLDCWFRINRSSMTGDALLWDRIWVENETRLRTGIGLSENSRRNARKIVTQCLADAAAPGSSYVHRAISSAAPSQRGLIRSCDDAHRREVCGVLQVGDRLVSWGVDGAIRFWELDGSPAAGGDPAAHARGVVGVHQMGNRLVSWGGDGAIRFWELNGSPAVGGDPAAHARQVDGVRQVGDRLVSWGVDGAIRFWELNGSPAVGGDPAAHGGWVRGVLQVGDRLVSWGGAGAIRFWELDGSVAAGGDPKAHAGMKVDVLQVSDRLVSWGGDGAIRFWELDGSPAAGGDPAAHARGVVGVHQVGNRLVSWGGDGAIRFWELDGSPAAGGDPKAHAASVQGVRQVGDRLVSWGGGRAIRFWELNGSPAAGGDPAAHAGWVLGVRQVGDRLVSWGGDGAIRFWELDGSPAAGGDPAAHAGLIHGVLQVGNRLVSWGGDGAIRFWELDGSPAAGGDQAPHASTIVGVCQVGDRLVSWGGDGAIRFWELDGSPAAGGDPAAHARSVDGMRQVGDRLVSWCAGGTIRFWELDGSPAAGNDPAADAGWVQGVRQVGNRLVSWSNDGAIRFWELDGSPAVGGDPAAHARSVVGVHQVGNRLVSWGADGAIRFWELDGSPAAGGDPAAHDAWVVGVRQVGNRLVSWGGCGAIRFWELDGSPAAGGDPAAHAKGSKRGVIGVRQVGNRLVSWGRDGAIRFWELDGSPAADGDPAAHAGPINGVRQVGDRLVSWGEDGAMRFWELDGSPAAGGDPAAHDAMVVDVLKVGDRIVSWGLEGAIRFWELDGSPAAGGDPAAHARGLVSVRQVGDRLVSWGKDGTIRFWELDGSVDEIIVVPGGFRKLIVTNSGNVVALGRILWIYPPPTTAGDKA